MLASVAPVLAQDTDPDNRSATALQTDAAGDVRLIEPGPLPGATHARKVMQPEETPPGRPLGPAPSLESTDPGIKPIGEVGINILAPPGEMPTDLAAPYIARAGVILPPATENRDWMDYSYYWMATAYCHQPLYFEEVNVERYGFRYRYGLQPLVSCAHFFATIPLLPYKMVVHPPSECQYTLGYYRPGDPALRQRERIHIQADAGAAEVGTVIGMILLIGPK